MHQRRRTHEGIERVVRQHCVGRCPRVSLDEDQVAGLVLDHNQLGEGEILLDPHDGGAYPLGELWVVVEIASSVSDETRAARQVRPPLVFADALQATKVRRLDSYPAPRRVRRKASEERVVAAIASDGAEDGLAGFRTRQHLRDRQRR